jgi:hypothetical protein
MTTASYPSSEKPGLVTAIAVMTLLNGIVNIFWGLTVSVALIWTLVCWPIGILQTVLGIFEIIYAAKLLGNPPQPVQPGNNLAVMEIVCILTGNVFSMIVGILALVFYNDLTVKNYFAGLNGPTLPAPPAAPVPAAPLAPLPDAAPDKSKGPRKVA